MGKSNRIKANKALKASKAPLTKKKGKGMPSWLMTLITLVVTAAVLLTVAFGLLSANGVFNRMRVSLSSDHYKINTNMMSYYFYTQYQSFQTEYESYLSYLSLDKSKSLKEQEFGKDTTKYDASFLGEFEGTWFDYFMNQTVVSAKGILLYCEEANARGITLDDNDMAEIETNIESIRTTASTYGYTLNNYLAASFGPGVKLTDVRKAIEYSALANKCMNAIVDELELAATEERIENRYNETKNNFNSIDYSTYTFTVDYTEIAKEELGSDHTDAELKENEAKVLAAYQTAVQKAKDRATALEKADSADAFMKMVCEFVAEDAVEDIYNSQTIKDEDKPSDEDVKAIKLALRSAVVDELMAGKGTAEPVVTLKDGDTIASVYGKTVTAEYAKTLNTVKTNLFNSVNTEKKKILEDKASYVAENEFSEWAFADGRVAGEKKVVVEGDGKEEGEIKKEQGYSYVSAYYLRAAQYRNTEKARDVAYAIYDTAEKAAAAITELGKIETMSLEEFEKAVAGATGNTHIEDCVRGYLNSDIFDEWLYGSATALGAITQTPLELATNNYSVAYYYGEGDEHWHIAVKETLISEDYDAEYAAIEEKYSITVNEKALAKVSA